ncbi:MAG: hypothetical protein Q9209_007797 [Squamulea sp. 1 TL-2023]
MKLLRLRPLPLVRVSVKSPRQFANTAQSKEFVNTIEGSTLFKSQWDDILSMVPMTLSTLGGCFIAATSSDAQNSTIKALGKDGFSYIQKDAHVLSLNACLILCATSASEAFSTAYRNMDQIRISAQGTHNTIVETVKLLMPPMTTKDITQNMKSQIDQLSKHINRCAAAADGIDAAFDIWLNIATEIHCCLAQDSTEVSELLVANKIAMAAENAKATNLKTAVDKAQEAVDKQKEVLDVTKDAYKKASDEFPHGWEAVAQHVVMSLADGYAAGIKAALPALAANLTPGGEMNNETKVGKNLFKKQLRDKGLDSLIDQVEAKPKNQKRTSENPPDYHDPAYTHIVVVVQQIGILRTLLSAGKEGGVDWIHIVKGDGKGKSALRHVWATLQHYKDAFKPDKTEPSKTLTNVLDVCLKTITAVNKYMATNIEMKKLPAAQSPEPHLKKLDPRTKNSGDDDEQPGGHSGDQSGDQSGGQSGGESNDKSSSGGDALLDAASHRLDTASNAYDAAQKTYLKANDSLLVVQKQVAEVQGELAKLTATDATLETTKKVLIKCIGIIIEIKKQIRKLQAFYSGMALLIDGLIQLDVEPLVQALNNPTNDTSAFGDFTYSTFQLQVMYTNLLTVMGYTSVFKKISQLYTEVHEKYIQEGFNKIDDMSAENDEALDAKETQDKVTKLNQWTDTAKTGIETMVKQGREAIDHDLTAYAKEAANDLKDMPLQQPQHVKNAIEDGKKVSTHAAEKHVDGQRNAADTSDLKPDTGINSGAADFDDT